MEAYDILTSVKQLDNKLDNKIASEINKMGMNLTWRLTVLMILVNGMFLAFERTL